MERTLIDPRQIRDWHKGRVHVYRDVAGTAAVITSPRWSTLYDVTDPEITEYYDGMLVSILVPVAGNGSYGTALQINSLGYKPIVFEVSSMISTRYPVGGVILAQYNAAQTAKIYLGGGHQNETVTGCWQVMDYNSDTTIISRLRLERGSTPVIANTYREVLVCTNLDGEVVPLHSTPASASSQYSSTGTNKEMSREPFSPFGLIAYNATPGIIAPGGNILYERLYHQTYFNPRYSLNCGEALVAAPLYLVAEPAEDGQARLVGKRPCWSQELPTQYDGLIYILLGHHSGDTYSMLYPSHPVYWHNGDHICVWSGDENHARDLAPVERGPVASGAYADGDLMVTGMGLRRATENIPSNGTLAGKTERTTVAEELKRCVHKTTQKSAKKNGIVVLKRINPAKTRCGQRYFFSTGNVTIFLDNDTYNGVVDCGFGTMLQTDFSLIETNPKGSVYRGKRVSGDPLMVTIIPDAAALLYGNVSDVAVGVANWLIYMQHMYHEGYATKQLEGFSNASKLNTNDLASPYFVIRNGEVVCTKEVLFKNKMHQKRAYKWPPIGRRITKRTRDDKPPKYRNRGNGWDAWRRTQLRKDKGAVRRQYDVLKWGKIKYGKENVFLKKVYGIARGKKSIHSRDAYTVIFKNQQSYTFVT